MKFKHYYWARQFYRCAEGAKPEIRIGPAKYAASALFNDELALIENGAQEISDPDHTPS